MPRIPLSRPAIDGHANCRVHEFQRWTRVMLEHERSHLSTHLARAASLIDPEEKAAIVHEITDIDYFLSLESPDGDA